MLPDIRIGSLVFGWYNLIVMLTIVTCIIFFIRTFYRRYYQIKISKLICVIYLLIIVALGFIGARIASTGEHILTSITPHSIGGVKALLLDKGGLMWYGGFILILMLLPLLLLFFSQDTFLKLLDITSLTCCLGYGLGRFACLISGDGCYGKWTNLPWGMYFPYGSAPNLLPVHPTPFYESLLHFLLLSALLRLDKRKVFLGQTFCLYLFFTACFRFFIEFVRVNERIYWSMSFAQIISLFLILTSTIIYCLLRLKFTGYSKKLNYSF